MRLLRWELGYAGDWPGQGRGDGTCWGNGIGLGLEGFAVVAGWDMFPSTDGQMGQFGGMERQMGPGGKLGLWTGVGALSGTLVIWQFTMGKVLTTKQWPWRRPKLHGLRKFWLVGINSKSQEFLPKLHQFLTSPSSVEALPSRHTHDGPSNMTRPFSGCPQCQSPSLNWFSLSLAPDREWTFLPPATFHTKT